MVVSVNVAFQTRDPLQGVSERIRRAIAQANFYTEQIERLVEVCKRLKLKTERKAYKPEAWAHLAIPSHKVALYVRDVLETAKIAAMRASWKKYGWEMLAITNRKIDALTDEQLAAQLTAALEEVRK